MARLRYRQTPHRSYLQFVGTFWGEFCELPVEIFSPPSDEVLCTTFSRDLPCMHDHKSVGMVDLVDICVVEGMGDDDASIRIAED